MAKGKSSRGSKAAIRTLTIDELLSTDELPAAKVAEAAAKPRLKKPVSAAYLAGEATGPAAAVAADPLPLGWVAMQDEDGDVFYYHAATAVAQWERPVAKAAAPAPAPAPAAASAVKSTAATSARTLGVASSAGSSRFGASAASATSAAGKSTTAAASPASASAARTTAGSSSPAVGAKSATSTTPAAGSASKAAAAPAPAPAPAPSPAAAGSGAAASAADNEKGCGDFTANPFKPTMCKHCRKSKDKH